MPQTCPCQKCVYLFYRDTSFFLHNITWWLYVSKQGFGHYYHHNSLQKHFEVICYNIYLFEFEKNPRHPPPLAWLLIGRWEENTCKKIIPITFTCTKVQLWHPKIPTQTLYHIRCIPCLSECTHFSLRHMSFSLQRRWHFL